MDINSLAEDPRGCESDYEAIIIGAGFGGLRMIYELQKRGVTAKVFEAGGNVGGTWYWNRYPGARTDSEGWVYVISLLEEIDIDWKWKERFPTQPEVEQYLNRISDHLDLRKHIEFNTRVTKAHRDEVNNVWRVTTAKGSTVTCTFLITATGPLATPLKPPFPGLDTFQGEWYQTGLWPNRKIDFLGKRVAVVGTGATGVQVIPTVAHSAKTLTVFQRTPNYVLPGRNHAVTEDQLLEIKQNQAVIAKRARSALFGMNINDSKRMVTDVESDAEHQRILERGWEIGGFRFIFETFGDMLIDSKSNDVAAEFIRNKIRAIVDDKETAELLCPHYPFLAKRPPLGNFYYETFNRANVKLVDIQNNPITEITSTGLRTGITDYDADMIIFALGFDAITGTLAQIEICGCHGQCLSDQLNEKMATSYGIAVEGFPNLFMISGPQSPFANIPVVIDNTVDWISQVLVHMHRHGFNKIETTKEMADTWSDRVSASFNATVLSQAAKDTHSWFVGSNVDGKKVEPLLWFGGVASYFAHCAKEIDNGFPGFRFSSPIPVKTN